MVESIPVHESIKQAAAGHERHIANYQQSLRHLAECGITTVCYNFMPVLDWTRTDLAWQLPEGGTALRFDQDAFAAFDLYLLERPGAEREYSSEEQQAARQHLETLDDAGREKLIRTIIAGLPGAEEGYSLVEFRASLAAYDGIDAARLRQHLATFLKAIVPVAKRSAFYWPSIPIIRRGRCLACRAWSRAWWMPIGCWVSYPVRPMA